MEKESDEVKVDDDVRDRDVKSRLEGRRESVVSIEQVVLADMGVQIELVV